MLCSFNDEFIAEMCGGLNDDDTIELFANGIEAMQNAVEESLRRTTDSDVSLTIEDGMFVADLTPQEAAEEFGAPGVMLKASYRQGFIQAGQDATLAFDKAVNREW